MHWSDYDLEDFYDERNDYDEESINDQIRESVPDECEKIWKEFVEKLLSDVKATQKELFAQISRETLEIYDENIDYINDTDAEMTLYIGSDEDGEFSIDVHIPNEWEFKGEYEDPEYFTGDSNPYYQGGWTEVELDITDEEYKKVLEELKKDILSKVKEQFGINEAFKGQQSAAKRLLQII